MQSYQKLANTSKRILTLFRLSKTSRNLWIWCKKKLRKYKLKEPREITQASPRHLTDESLSSNEIGTTSRPPQWLHTITQPLNLSLLANGKKLLIYTMKRFTSLSAQWGHRTLWLRRFNMQLRKSQWRYATKYSYLNLGQRKYSPDLHFERHRTSRSLQLNQANKQHQWAKSRKTQRFLEISHPDYLEISI